MAMSAELAERLWGAAEALADVAAARSLPLFRSPGLQAQSKAAATSARASAAPHRRSASSADIANACSARRPDPPAGVRDAADAVKRWRGQATSLRTRARSNSRRRCASGIA